MADIRKLGSTANIVRLLLTKSTDGTPFTGASNASSGLIVSTIADNEAAAVAYTVAGSNVETITTIGAWSAPTTGKCRFKEVDATNHPGLYELHFSDSRFSVSNARRLIITISGVTGLFSANYEIQLTQADVYDATSLGLSRLDAAVTSRMASYTQPTGFLAATFPSGTIANTINITAASGVTVSTNNDKTGYALSSAAVQAIWDALTSALTAVGSIGKLLVDNINATIGSRSTYAGSDTSGTTTLLSRIVGTLATGTHNPQSGDAYARLGATPPTAATIAAAVWDLTVSGHTTSGTFGAAMNAAGSSGDPWSTSLPGSYAAGTAGYIVGTNLNAQVSAIKSKTDNLPVDPADASDVASAFSAVNSTLTVIAGYVDTLETEVAKVIKTGQQFTATDGTGSKNVTFTRVI